MPRQDAHHEAVKTALIKDGWTVTHDPFVISLKDVKFYIDLAAEKDNRVAIEVKVFGGISFLNEFEKAVGQYLIYEQFLEEMFPERRLYLAVPLKVFEKSFALLSIQAIVKRRGIKLLVFDAQQKEIVRWIE